MNFLDVFVVSVSVASVVAALGIAVVVVHMVAHYFRTLPKPESGEPFLTVEYPHKVYAWSHLVTERECTTLLMDATLGDWEKPLCQKLGDGAYRMKLQFYRVEGGE